MKPRIKSVIWKVRKQKAIRKEKRKKESKNDNVRTSGITSSVPTFTYVGVLEEGQREQEIVNIFEKIMKENVPSLVKEVNIQDQEV